MLDKVAKGFEWFAEKLGLAKGKIAEFDEAAKKAETGKKEADTKRDKIKTEAEKLIK